MKITHTTTPADCWRSVLIVVCIDMNVCGVRCVCVRCGTRDSLNDARRYQRPTRRGGGGIRARAVTAAAAAAASATPVGTVTIPTNNSVYRAPGTTLMGRRYTHRPPHR